MQKRKKTAFLISSLCFVFVVLVMLFISPITKYIVEGYSERYTGRQITMDYAYVNPLTGFIYFDELKIYEQKNASLTKDNLGDCQQIDSVFFAASGLSLNFSMLKLFYKTYEISKLTISHPMGIIIQNDSSFNFTDLIDKFSSQKKPEAKRAPIQFNLLDIKIIDGEFHYREQEIPINYFIKNVNFESTGKRWDSDTIAGKFDFVSGVGSGEMKGDFTMDVKNKDYRMALFVNKFELNIIEQYLNDLTNYGNFSAILDANMKWKGNFDEAQNVTSSGLLAINDFHFGKNKMDDYVSFKKLVIDINELSPKKQIYFYDSISLNEPYFKYERYDYLDNVQKMFGEKGVNLANANAADAKFNLVVEIAKYIKKLSSNFFKSSYKINRLAIYNGDIKFNDFSLGEKFSAELSPVNIIADSVNKKNTRVSVSIKSGIQPYGKMAVNLSINPNDSSDFDLFYDFQKIPISMFNPYLISYTTFPLDRGTLELNGKWNVLNGSIQSKNHLLIIDPRVAKRIRIAGVNRIPVLLLMSFIRDKGNVIDYEIPITGNLKDPKFHFSDVVLDVLENIIVKPLTTPYRMEVKIAEQEIEKSQILTWQTRQVTLRNNQENYIKKIADFLLKNPDSSLDIYHKEYALKENEYILFFEAKKLYFLEFNKITEESFREEDSEKVDKMAIKDTLFIAYLNKYVKDSMMFTIQEKCSMLVGEAVVNRKYKQLCVERENAFMHYFKKVGVENQVKIIDNLDIIPYNGFSFFKIEYNFILPESLLKAYDQMNELDNEGPRNKLIISRNRIKS